jgi:heme exporter protein D
MMLDFGPHAAFIIWAYAGVALGSLLLIGFAIVDSRRVAKRLRDLEARGIRRRSSDASR